MKEDTRSIATKNMVGGFLGGTCGILTCGYIYPFLMPLGVLVGVIAGWWYEAIWNMIVKNINDGIQLVENYIQRSRVFIEECSQFSLKSLFQRKKKEDDLLFSLFSVIETVSVWFITRPIACVKWFNRHPMNRAYFLRAVIFSLEIACIVAIVACMVNYFMPENLGGGVGYDGKLVPPRAPRMIDYVFMTGIISFFFTILPLICYLEKFNDYNIRDFYRDFECYASLGPIKYILNCTFEMLNLQARIVAMIVLGFIYFSGMGLIFVAIFVAPLAIFIWTVKGINEVVMRQGHWLCLGVTMIVTSTAAYLFNPYFGNISILWVTALSTGIVSGGVTEGIRRTIAWVIENTEIGSQYANAQCWEFLKDRLNPCWNMVLNIWDKSIQKPLLLH